MDYSQYPHLELRRKFWKFFGAEISVTPEGSDQLVGFIKVKAFKLREDVRLYTDRSLQTEVMAIQARQIIDFGATYDVTDSATGQPLFALRRKGLRSVFVRDYWDILDPAGNVIGFVRETSGSLALLRRWLGAIELFDPIFAFVVQRYEVRLGTGEQAALAAEITHRKNPFIVKMSVDRSMAPQDSDPRIVLASAALLAVIDAAKNG